MSRGPFEPLFDELPHSIALFPYQVLYCCQVVACR